MLTENENKLPALALDYDDGWNDTEIDDRVIQGTLLKCIDGVWSAKDGTTPPKQLLALATTTVIQLWDHQMPVETIIKRPGQPLPDLDELNAKIPEEDWEIGLGGEKRAPYQKQWIVYFLDPLSAAKYTYANGTIGARIAVSDLKDAIKWMRAMRGEHVLPLIEFANKTRKFKRGPKLCPDFKVIEWRNLDGSVARETTPQIVAPVSVDEDMSDSIGF